MSDFAAAILDTVVAMAVTSFCFLGAPLKHEAHATPRHAHQIIVRRIPVSAPAAGPSASSLRSLRRDI